MNLFIIPNFIIVDVENLPDPVPRGSFQPGKLDSGKATIVTLDLDATDLSKFAMT